MSVARVALAVLLACLLSACAGRMARPDVAPLAVDPAVVAAAQAAQAARVAWLQRHPGWSLAGRVAISNAGKGGSGRIDWTQDGRAYEVSLSAPVTRQSWRLVGNLDGGARLEGLEGGTREGGDPAVLLREATGWEVPVRSLGDWALGRLAGGGQGEVRYGTDGRLQRLAQDGWTIEYLAWHEAQGERPTMPARIDASRDGARVRLIVDQWDLGAR